MMDAGTCKLCPGRPSGLILLSILPKEGANTQSARPVQLLERGLLRSCDLCRWHSHPARLKCLLRWLDMKSNTPVTPLSAAAS